MPPYPGEERLVTLFTDCHYYFAQPTARPVLHRFDKASYFYIYWNSTRQTSRIEVANNPGTPEQDAFSGYLDTCRIINSYRFPTLVTLVVDATDHAPSPSSKVGRDPEEWRLPNADPRDGGQNKHRLHTVDFYFWTQEDAKLVTEFFRKLLNPSQMDLVLSKQTQQQPQQQQQQNRRSGDAGVSSVVQNLENVAITDPAYSNGQTRNSQNQPQAQTMTIPPPPPPPTQGQQNARTVASPSSAVSRSPVSQLSHADSRKSPGVEKPQVDYTPMVYNPAAPAAPEKIAHREKTPPPEDGTHGTGLSTAAVHDKAHTPGYSPSQAWGAPPTLSQASSTNTWGSPPPQSSVTPGYGPGASSSVGYTSPPPGSSSQPARSSATSGTMSFAPPPPNPSHSQDAHRHSTAAETYTPQTHSGEHQNPAETPGSQFYSSINQPSRPLQHVQPQYADYLAGGTKPGQQPPPGGFTDYSYAQGGQFNTHSGDQYDVHNQVYRPAEYEANPRRHSKPSRADTATTYTKTTRKESLFSKVSRRAEAAIEKGIEKGKKL